MSQLILRGVLERVLRAKDLDLSATDVGPALLHQVGNALTEMMLEHGHRRVDQYIDGRDVVVNFYCSRSGRQLRPLATTLVGVSGARGDGLAMLLRDGGRSDRTCSIGAPIRFAGVWYVRLAEWSTISDVIAYAMEDYDREADHVPFVWSEVA